MASHGEGEGPQGINQEGLQGLNQAPQWSSEAAVVAAANALGLIPPTSHRLDPSHVQDPRNYLTDNDLQQYLRAPGSDHLIHASNALGENPPVE